MTQARSYTKKRKGTNYLKGSRKFLHPRVGEEYRANLPTFLSPSNPYGIGWEGNVNLELPFATWTDLEIVSLLVALYFFGKNFFLAREFLCGTDMGDIQSFYNGRFYNSVEYRRWAKCRKSARDQKPLTATGTKIIFLHLHPQVPQEFRDAAREAHQVCKDTASLAYYALVMKNTFGPEALLEGIQRELTYLDGDEGQTSRTIARKKSKTWKHAKRGVDPPTLPVKRRKLTKLESKPIKDENVDQERKNELNDSVSGSSNGRRQSRRSRVMSTKVVEAFETCSIKI